MHCNILCVQEVVTHFISYFIKWVNTAWTYSIDFWNLSIVSVNQFFNATAPYSIQTTKEHSKIGRTMIRSDGQSG